MRTMGESSSVPIEPPSQTKLLDACTNEIPGVVGAGVPGGTFSLSDVLCVAPRLELRTDVFAENDSWRLRCDLGPLSHPSFLFRFLFRPDSPGESRGIVERMDGNECQTIIEECVGEGRKRGRGERVEEGTIGRCRRIGRGC